MKLFLAMVLSYGLGCLNPACYLAKRKGFDIRERGTSNPGATNAMFSMGLPSGILVMVLDIGKSMLSIFLTSLLCHRALAAKILAGFCCTLGHVFPVTMHFRGGKGTACVAGLVLYLSPELFLPMAAGAFVIGVICDRASLLPPLVSVIYPPLYYLTHRGVREAAMLLLFIPLIFWTHRKNQASYEAGEEIGVRKFFFGRHKHS